MGHGIMGFPNWNPDAKMERYGTCHLVRDFLALLHSQWPFTAVLLTRCHAGVAARADGDAELQVQSFEAFHVPSCDACGGVWKPKADSASEKRRVELVGSVHGGSFGRSQARMVRILGEKGAALVFREKSSKVGIVLSFASKTATLCSLRIRREGPSVYRGRDMILAGVVSGVGAAR